MSTSAASHLARWGIGLDLARTWVLANIPNPAAIYNVATSFGLTAEMLAEVVGGGVTAQQIASFFAARGFDSAPIMETLSAQVGLRNTSTGSLGGLASAEVRLPEPVKVADVQAIAAYASSAGTFGSGAQVVLMREATDPPDHTSAFLLVPGAANTFVPGTTTLTFATSDSHGVERTASIALPQVRFMGGTGNDIYASARSDELFDLTPQGSDTVVLARPPGQGNDWVYGFQPGAAVGRDVFDLRAFALSRGIADAQPGTPAIEAFGLTAASATDVSNQAVLVHNTGTNFNTTGNVQQLFAPGGPLALAAGARAVVFVFETADNMEDVYFVDNDNTAAVTAAEVTKIADVTLVGSYVPGSGTYADGSFVAANFIF